MIAETFAQQKRNVSATRFFAAMNPRNKEPLDKCVATAALAAQGYAGVIDVLGSIGWLSPGTVGQWRRGQIDCLERAIQANPARIAEALNLSRAWAKAKGLDRTQALLWRTSGRF